MGCQPWCIVWAIIGAAASLASTAACKHPQERVLYPGVWQLQNLFQAWQSECWAHRWVGRQCVSCTAVVHSGLCYQGAAVVVELGLTVVCLQLGAVACKVGTRVQAIRFQALPSSPSSGWAGWGLHARNWAIGLSGARCRGGGRDSSRGREVRSVDVACSLCGNLLSTTQVVCAEML
jgi:hypothetical protein